MKDDRQEGIEKWISEWFQRRQIAPEDQSVACRYFLGVIDQLKEREGIDVWPARYIHIDPDSPDYGTYGDFVESQSEASFDCYKQAINGGHSAAYSDAYGLSAGRDEESVEFASSKAYDSIRSGLCPSPEDPAYQDAYGACLKQGKSPEFAERCATFLYDYDFIFSRAFKATEVYETACKLTLDRGHSELRARMYAERMLDSPSTDFAEFYAESVEEQINQGRKQSDAEDFAEIHAEILFDYGKPDEADPEYKILELHLRAKAEAKFRYRSGDGHEALFLDTFDQIHQRLSDSPLVGTLVWFDEVEKRTRKELSEPGSQLGPNGCLNKDYKFGI